MIATVLAANDGNRFTALNGIPSIDLLSNLRAAVAAGRRMTSILGEVVALRRGAGRLMPDEYFYYRLWEPHLARKDKRRFVGKQAQQPMHLACNNTGWYATAADNLLFHTLMTGAGLPTPELLAITQPARRVPSGRVLGAIGLGIGQVVRVVQGTGVAMIVDDAHADTGRPIVGTRSPTGTTLRRWSRKRRDCCPAFARSPGTSLWPMPARCRWR